MSTWQVSAFLKKQLAKHWPLLIAGLLMSVTTVVATGKLTNYLLSQGQLALYGLLFAKQQCAV